MQASWQAIVHKPSAQARDLRCAIIYVGGLCPCVSSMVLIGAKLAKDCRKLGIAFLFYSLFMTSQGRMADELGYFRLVSQIFWMVGFLRFLLPRVS